MIVASNIIGSIGWGLCWTYLNFRLYDIGATYLQLCLMDSLAAITYLSSRFWGALSDYYGRRKPFMISGFFASALPVIVMALRNADIWALLLSYLMACFFWAIAYPAYMAALTSDPEREKATMIFSLVGSVGFAIGSSVMGPAEALLGPSGLFFLCFLILTAFPASLIIYSEEPLPRKPGSPLSYARGAFSIRLRASAGFGFLLIGVFLAWLGLQWASPLARMRLYDLLGRSKLIMGLLWGMSSVASAVALVLAREAIKKFGGLGTLTASTACYAIIMLCFAIVENPVAYAILWLMPVWSFFNLGYVLSPAEFTSEDVRGEAMGACEVAKNLGVLIGLSGGFLADVLGREASLAISAVPLALALLPLTASKTRMKGKAKAILGGSQPVPA